jgi:hypothetical protein
MGFGHGGSWVVGWLIVDNALFHFGGFKKFFPRRFHL